MGKAKYTREEQRDGLLIDLAASLNREDALTEKLNRMPSQAMLVRWAELCEKGHGLEVAEEIRQAAERGA